MKKKKIPAFLVSAALIVALAMSLTACGSSTPKDTAYKGRISAETYADENTAAQAYLAAELGESAVFVSYAKSGDMTEKEIAALQIDDTLREGITAGEKGDVSYTAATRAADPSAKTARVYILHYDGVCRYYAPALQKGDALTTGYFEEIFRSEKYANGTYKAEVLMDNSTKVGSMSQSQNIKVTMTIEVDDKYMYMTTTMGEETTEMFFIFPNGVANATDDNYKMYTKVDGVWTESDGSGSGSTGGDYGDDIGSDIGGGIGSIGSGIGDIGDIAGMGDDMDPSLFVKTDSGFKLDPDKVNAMFAALGAAGELPFDPSDIKLSADFTVRDGRLTGIEISMEMHTTMNEGTSTMTMDMTYDITVKGSRFGSTEVTVPEGIPA